MNNIYKLSLFKTITIALTGIILLFIGTILFISKMAKTTDMETDIYLAEVSKQSAAHIKTKIEADFGSLQDVALLLGQYASFNDMQDILYFLESKRINNNYKRIGLLLPSGRNYLSNGQTWEELSSNTLLTDAQKEKNAAFTNTLLSGQKTISSILADRGDGTQILVQAAPIMQNNWLIGSLFATRSIEDYKKELSAYSFNNQGFSYIIDANGEILINSNNPENLLEYGNNYFDEMKSKQVKIEDGVTVEQLRIAMQDGKSGSARYAYGSTHKNMHFSPIGFEDWYLLSIVPSKILNKQNNRLYIFTIVLSASIMLFFVGLLLLIIKTAKESRKKLAEVAFSDALTHQSNINKFRIDLMATLHAYKNTKFALITFDIDKFKVINSIFGDKQGNLVLQHVANVLRQELTHKELSARVVSDVFVMLMPYNTIRDTIARLEHLHKNLLNCYAVVDSQYAIGFSFGIYKITDPDLPFYTMLDCANLARINAKKNPAIIYSIYEQNLTGDMVKNKFIENNIKSAMDNKEVQVYFQPKFDLETKKIIGAEVLARWQHPLRGIISPDDFIPELERSGKIIKFDYYMMEQTATILKQWKDAGLPVLPISINQSRLHLTNPDFPEIFREIFARHGIRPSDIELELTESAICDGVDALPKIMGALHEIGFVLSMDDFGTGYSSLNVLKTLPVDVVKMDKAFLSNISENTRAAEVIRSSIQMIKNLGIKVIAEGIEDEKQVAFLLEAGCKYGQGYFFAKPMPSDEFKQLLLKNKPQ